MGYSIEALKGVSWVGALRLATRGLAFVRIAILARLLNPAQFGTFGIAALTLGFVEIFTETGINVFLIQEKEGVEKYLHTAWVVAIVRGLLIGLILLVTAPLVATFFHAPQALLLLVLISIVPFIKGFINPSVIIFQKELRFHQEFYFRLVILLVEFSATILLAFLTQSAISIVLGQIVSAMTEVILSFLLLTPKPKLTFVKEHLQKVLHHGRWVTAAGIFNYLFHNADNVVVGRLLNVSALGLYQTGYTISTLPITEIADVVSKVAFPVYVKIADDKQRLWRAFIRSMYVVSLLAIPFGLLLFVFTRELVILVLGEKWVSAVPAIKVLCIFGVVRAISGTTSALFYALKKQQYVSVVTMVSVIGLAIPIIPLVQQYGIVGAGLAALIGSLVALPFIYYYTWKIFHTYS